MKNESLLQTTLLGTIKKNFTADSLPPILQPAIQHSPNAETALLNALTATLLYERAGYCGNKLAIASYPVCLPEKDLSPAPKAADLLLSEILGMNNERIVNALLCFLLEKFIQRKWHITPIFLNRLLLLAKKLPPELLLQCIGERGKWLWQIRIADGDTTLQEWPEEMAASGESAAESIWEEGKYEVRVQTLRQCRATKPDTARTWLEKTWDNVSINEKITFVKILQNNLSEADLPFLTGILAGLNAIPTAKIKAKQQELRQIVADFIARIPESDAHKALHKAVRACLHTGEKTRLGKANKKEINAQLPTLDGFWAADNLLQQYGLEVPKNLPADYNPAGYCLANLMQYIPPSVWNKMFDMTAKEVIDCLLIDKTDTFCKQFAEEIFAALNRACINYPDADYADYLLEIALQKEAFTPKLLPNTHLFISAEAQKKLLVAHYVHVSGVVNGQNLYSALLRSLPNDQKWDMDFSRALLDKYEKESSYYYSDNTHEILLRFAQAFPDALIENLEDEVKKRIEALQKSAPELQSYYNHTVLPLTNIHQIVKKIKSL